VQQALQVAAHVAGTVVVTIGAGTAYEGGVVQAPATPGDETAITLQSSGGAAVTLHGSPIDTNGFTDDQPNVPATLIGITIKRSTTGFVATGVVVKGASVRLVDVAVITANDDAVFASADATVTITSSAITNPDVGVYATAGASVTVVDSTIAESANTTVVATNGAKVTLTGSTISGSEAAGVRVNGHRSSPVRVQASKRCRDRTPTSSIRRSPIPAAWGSTSNSRVSS
jgi:hypothetical protein